MHFTRLGQIRHARMRTHQNVRRVQGTFQEPPLRLGQVNTAQRSLGQIVGRHQSQTIDPHLMNGVDCLEHARHPLERLFFATVRPLLRYYAYPFVAQHSYAKHSDPSPINKLHRFHSQNCRYDIVCVMLSP